jgi:hypothetical protein
VTNHAQQGQGVDPQAVIDHLGRQIGALSAQLAMRDVALEEAQERINFLEEQAANPPAPPTEGLGAPELPPPAGKDEPFSDDLPTSHIPMPPAKKSGTP